MPRISRPAPLAPAMPCRHDVLYRTVTDAKGRPLNVGCGFMLKPGRHGAYHQRTMSTLVVVCLLRGRGTFTDWLGRAHDVHAGHVIILPPHRPHSVAHHPDGQWAEFFFVCPAQTYTHMTDMTMLPADQPTLTATLDTTMLDRFEHLHTLTRTLPDSDLPIAWAHAQLLLADMARQHRQGSGQPSPIRDRMLEACRLLADKPEKRISAQAIAARLGMGYELFRKRFRQETGLSPGEFRIRRRMELARKLIADLHLSNKEVAYRLGYADPFTFSKQFQRYTGQSPTTFRRSI